MNWALYAYEYVGAIARLPYSIYTHLDGWMGVANKAHGTADSKWAESVTQASKQAASSTVDRK